MANSVMKNILWLTICVTAIYSIIIYMPSALNTLAPKMQILRSPSLFVNIHLSRVKFVEKHENAPRRISKKDNGMHRMRDLSYFSSESSLEHAKQDTAEENYTNWMNHVKIQGRIVSSRNYAVFSVTLDSKTAQDYTFYLPLTTLAWKRIGFDSVIMVLGSSNESFSDPVIRHVLSRCLELDAVLIYVYSSPEIAVVVSHVGRLFAANILSATFSDIDLVYLIISDVDLWPINPDIYRLRSDMAMLCLTTGCYSSFVNRGVKCNLLPMSNFGMRIMTWKKMTQNGSFTSKSSEDLRESMHRVFGPVSLTNAHRGWYLYQMKINAMVKNWTDQYGSHRVMFVPRKTETDRINGSQWEGDTLLYGKLDAQMPRKPFSTDTWKNITPLLRSMYGYHSERYNWSLEYYESYRRIQPKLNTF